MPIGHVIVTLATAQLELGSDQLKSPRLWMVGHGHGAASRRGKNKIETNYVCFLDNKGHPALLSNYVSMSRHPGQLTLHLADSIIDCPTRGTSMNLPIAALRRLDAMAQEARLIRTSRNELLAALISTTAVDQDKLETVVTTYRRLTIRDVLPTDADESERSVVVPLRKPGRPAVSSGSA